MAQDATLHIKVEPSMARALKTLAKKRGQTMGELVRQAISSCYHTDLLGLDQRQSQALSAYFGGYISLGKLAETMGRTIPDTRIWLTENSLPQNTEFEEEDVANA